ncbi:MAG: type IV pili methyl-accepting chemotaxis transducer N-terminal domain-containing protein, partial [Raineya sp.]
MKRFRTTYIIALIAIAIFVIIGELAVQFGLRGLSDDARVINLSGRQRMLSQKITKSALIMSQTESMETFQERKKELTEALNNWRRSHEALQKGDLVLGIKNPPNSKEILDKFAQIQPFFEEMKEAASKISVLDFNSLDSAGRAQMKADIERLMTNEVKFLPLMDEITSFYESESKSRTNNVGLIAWIVGVSIVGLIILLAIFFFKPVVKRINNYLEEIEKQNKKLETAELEMRKTAEQQLELNEQLFLAQKQAQEQNEKLKAAEEEARKALERQERSNQKLLVAQRELQKTLAEQNRTNQKLLEIQKELEQKASEIEKSEKEMRQLAEAQLEANEKLLLAQRQEEKTKQELALNAQKQEVLNKILQKSILTNSGNLQEFYEYTVDTLGEVKFLELLPGIGIFTRKEGDVYEMVCQKNISPKIQEICHNIKTGQCLCGLAIKTKETQYA